MVSFEEGRSGGGKTYDVTPHHKSSFATDMKDTNGAVFEEGDGISRVDGISRLIGTA